MSGDPELNLGKLQRLAGRRGGGGRVREHRGGGGERDIWTVSPHSYVSDGECTPVDWTACHGVMLHIDTRAHTQNYISLNIRQDMEMSSERDQIETH